MLRRHFLKTALASSLASSAAFQAMALGKNNRYRKNIGIQLYTLRNQIAEDPVATLKAVADAGYKQVEPYGFPNAGPMIEAAKDFGLAVNSSHFAGGVGHQSDQGRRPPIRRDSRCRQGNGSVPPRRALSA